MVPAEVVLDLHITHAGVMNAVAMWFELQLDEETMLSTSPYLLGKGATWQQAVQWVQELRMDVGDVVQLVATHDTYGISFAYRQQEQAIKLEERWTGVPLQDPAWQISFDNLKDINSQVQRAQGWLQYTCANCCNYNTASASFFAFNCRW